MRQSCPSQINFPRLSKKCFNSNKLLHKSTPKIFFFFFGDEHSKSTNIMENNKFIHVFWIFLPLLTFFLTIIQPDSHQNFPSSSFIRKGVIIIFKMLEKSRSEAEKWTSYSSILYLKSLQHHVDLLHQSEEQDQLNLWKQTKMLLS